MMEPTKDLTVSLVQTSLYWEDAAANLSMLEKKIAAIQQTEVVILPEMFSTGFSMQPEKLAETMTGSSVRWMKRQAAKKNIILCGSLMIEENGSYYNRLLWVLPNGQTGCYDKRHLFAFGKEHQHYTGGDKRLIARVNGWKICLNICYDLRFPVWCRQSKHPRQADPSPEYDALICIANWPQQRSVAWKALLQARAIENQAYAIGVNRVGSDGNGISYDGHSAVIDPLGEARYCKSGREEVLTHTLLSARLKETRTRFPFLEDGDAFLLV